MSNEPLVPDTIVKTRPKPSSQTKTRLLPPYNVILENDEYHSMEFVVSVLVQALNCTAHKAVQLMLQAHNTGRAIIWTGAKEVAELKIEQISTFHETRESDGVKLGPLSCVLEPAPGS
jgi:ATP-dependent Clp protease adaptor protein ClpS